MTNVSGTHLNSRVAAGPDRGEGRESPSSLLRYAEYKDSGVAWLGDVPAHWSVSKVKTVIKAIDSGVSVNAVDTPAGEGSVGVLKTSCVYDGTFRFEENKAVLEDELSRVACAVEEDTVIVSRMNTPALVGAAGLVKESRPNIYLPDRLWQIHFQNCAPSFVHYWTLSPIYRYQVEIACAGTSSSMQNLGQDQFKSFWIPLPTFSEQSAIAAFLDRETGKIDALIAEQEKLLTLLAEKRQATISHAVTRGLNPNAPMKDSGVAWLGEVPAHWDVIPLKHLSPVQRGASPRPIDDPKYFDEDGEYSWVRITDVSASDGYLEATSQKLSELGSSLSVKLKPGDLFVSIAGTVGKPCISRIQACIHDGFVYFPRLEVPPIYLYRIFEAGVCYAGLGKMGTQLNLNTETIGSIRVALPPARELGEILAFLDQMLARLDSLSSEAECGIALLRERRSALIAAAVTGKIDVRQAA